MLFTDLMSNSLLAYNGYPRIGYAACIGSPLFNLLVGAGVSYTIKLARSEGHSAAVSLHSYSNRVDVWRRWIKSEKTAAEMLLNYH